MRLLLLLVLLQQALLLLVAPLRAALARPLPLLPVLLLALQALLLVGGGERPLVQT